MGKKHVLLFGGTGGIGQNLLPLLLHSGYFVSLAARSISDAEALVRKYSAEQQELVDVLQIDLESEKSLKDFLLRFQPEALDLIVFASGVRTNNFSLNLVTDFVVNYVSPITIGINLLERFPKLRIINVTSVAAFRFKLDSPNSIFSLSSSSYGGNYAKSKLALVLASDCLSKMYPDSHVISVDPGNNRSKMTLGKNAPLALRIAAGIFFFNPIVGAKRIMNAAMQNNTPSGAHINGNGKLRDLTHYASVRNYVQIEILKGYPYMPQ